jgi:glycosyl transferase, family 25
LSATKLPGHAMKSYVISLSSASQRRAHIESEFAARGVKFEFFDAVEPATVEATARVLGLDPRRTKLHQREVACLLSHVALWKKAVDEQLDHIAIFEDDIHLGEHADYFLASSSWIPAECRIVKLEVFYRRIVVLTDPPAIRLAHKRRLLTLAQAHMGGGGYILSRDAATELIRLLAQCNELPPVDHFVFGNYPRDMGHRVHQMSPALCIQDEHLTKGHTRFPSNLQDVRRIRRGENTEKKKLGFSGKAKREIGRVLNQSRRALKDLAQLFQGRRAMRLRFR